jgi:4-amino-4-deoxy-L-arabinose transferase-like glycosyltransferase
VTRPDPTLDVRTARLLVTVVAAIVIGGVASTLDRAAAPRADEGYYAAYADRIARDGVGSFPDLAREYIEETRHHKFPNPLRAGYLALAGGWIALRGNGPSALVELSLASHALTIALGFAFARRALGPAVGAAAAVLLACSPLLLGLSRRALSDSTATAGAVAVLFACYMWARSPREPRRSALFAAALAAALLLKESSALLLVPCAAYVALAIRPGERLRTLTGFALVAGGGVALALGVWTLATGGLGPFVRIVEIILASPETNLYAQQFGGGPWYRYLVDFLLLSPATTLLALCAVPFALVRAEPGESRDGLVFLAVTVAGLGLAHELFTKNVRYVAVLELPIRVFAAWAIVRASGVARADRRRLACIAAVAVWCALDLWSFYGIFVVDGLYDPVTAQLARVRGLIPPW